MKRDVIWRSEPCSHFRIARIVGYAGTVRYELIEGGHQAGVRYATKREALAASIIGCRAKKCDRAKPLLEWKFVNRRLYTSGKWRIESYCHRVGGRSYERMWNLKLNGKHVNFYETIDQAKEAAEKAERGQDIRPRQTGSLLKQGTRLSWWKSNVRVPGADTSGWNTAGNI